MRQSTHIQVPLGYLQGTWSHSGSPNPHIDPSEWVSLAALFARSGNRLREEEASAQGHTAHKWQKTQKSKTELIKPCLLPKSITRGAACEKSSIVND